MFLDFNDNFKISGGIYIKINLNSKLIMESLPLIIDKAD